MAAENLSAGLLDKKTLRRTFIARRQALVEHECSGASLRVAHHLKSVLPAAGNGAGLAAYLPHQREIDPLPALYMMQNSGFSIVLPVMPENEDAAVLGFRVWDVGDWSDLRPGRHAIPVPQRGPPLSPAALLIPLVAFTRRGERLGYGGGWYDRTLKFLRRESPEIPAIGLAFACQEADTLPVDSWDEPLTAIVTECEVIRCSAPPAQQGAAEKDATFAEAIEDA